MNGSWFRVIAVYPLILPAAFAGAAYLFPAYFYFNEEAGSLTFTITVEQAVAAFGAGYAAIAGVFAAWGKR
jgi:hypothetical protein